jgi:GntR family transcriptional regulator
VKHLVAAGRLAPGEEVPSIRALAEQLTINPNTVARAYLELEHTGIVTKRNGTGTFVSEVRALMPQREKIRILASRADALLTEARQLDVDLAEIIKLLRERNAIMGEEIGK